MKLLFNSSFNTKFRGSIVAIGLILLAIISNGQPFPYQNEKLSPDERADDLLKRLTLEEKALLMQNNSPAIERLGIKAYEWWNEALHGVGRSGLATVFPQAIGMAASFDDALLLEVFTAVSDEARAKSFEYSKQGGLKRYQGLTFWTPNINIFRDPRWGRGQETYGEDPFLAGQLGVAFVKGLQGNDPKYYRVIATAKHYAVHSGPEPDRHTFDAVPTERDLWETYLPAFRDLVQDGQAASVMSAYNRINGESATASQRFLTDILRDQWGFKGYVVSDCGAVDDIFRRHKIVPTAEEASAIAVKRGCDLECGSSYRALKAAVDKGLIKETELDVALVRLFEARFRLGLFDPPERVRWAQIPYTVNDAPAHDTLARRVAQSSMVLLKNTGILPLKKDTKTIAVVGPTADHLMSLLGNYNGTPSHPVTILEGIRAAVSPGTKVLYERGVDLVEGRRDPKSVPAVDTAALKPAAGSSEHGLKGEYFRGKALEGEPVLTRIDPKIEFRWDRGAPTDWIAVPPCPDPIRSSTPSRWPCSPTMRSRRTSPRHSPRSRPRRISTPSNRCASTTSVTAARSRWPTARSVPCPRPPGPRRCPRDAPSPSPRSCVGVRGPGPGPRAGRPR